MWPEGASEPAEWQARARDESGTRLTAGAVGVYADQPGDHHFDDLQVVALDLAAPFTANPATGSLSLTTTLVADPLGAILTYTWDYGDGSPLGVTTIPTTSHSYTQSGSYTVSLTVADGSGGTDVLTRPALITVLDQGGEWG